MIIEQSTHPKWLSNTWLVAAEAGGPALLIDSGGPAEPILEKIEQHRLEPKWVLCTHHHYDHVANNALFRERFGALVCGHAAERELFDGLDREIADGEQLECGELRVRALHIPGHTRGQLAFIVNEERVFTGDTLFRASVGGTRAPGHGSFVELRASILDRLMTLPHEWTVHPGHCEQTTLAHEWEHNPFLRLWRGLDPAGTDVCTALGDAATLLLSARDYDGGTKCQVRFDASGQVDVVAGSRVTRG